MFAKEYFHPFNEKPEQHKPLIVVGPSGVGKHTLVSAVLKEYGHLFERKKSYTTRVVKKIEKQKENFYFVSEEEFAKMREAGKFIETSKKENGDQYGTAYEELERIKKLGKIPIIEVDCNGAKEINQNALEANFLFIYPPSFAELRRRIGQRIETEQKFKVRIQEAIRQIELAN